MHYSSIRINDLMLNILHYANDFIIIYENFIRNKPLELQDDFLIENKIKISNEIAKINPILTILMKKFSK